MAARWQREGFANYYQYRVAQARERAAAAGQPLPTARQAAGHRAGGPASTVHTKAGAITAPKPGRTAGTTIANLRGDRHVKLVVTGRDAGGQPMTVELFSHGGIRAESLRELIEDAGGDFLEAIADALGAQSYGALEAVEAVSVVFT